MNFSEWVHQEYDNIPDSKRKCYSSDKLIAAVCYYRNQNKLYPCCVTEAEAKKFVASLLDDEEYLKKAQKKSLTEKSIKHDMKRNLPENTIVDDVFEKCARYLDSNGRGKSDDENTSALYALMVESGIMESEAAGKICSKIIKQHKAGENSKSKTPRTSTTYTEIRTYRFFTPAEVAMVKKKAIPLSESQHIDRSAVLKIIEEVIKIIEEIKGTE